jgi:hypothetical protein
MANILIEDMQPGMIITVICEDQGEIEGPDPGEEAPEDEEEQILRLVGEPVRASRS